MNFDTRLGCRDEVKQCEDEFILSVRKLYLSVLDSGYSVQNVFKVNDYCSFCDTLRNNNWKLADEMKKEEK